MPLEFTGVDWVNEDRKAQDGVRRRKLAKRRRKERRNLRRMIEQIQQIQRFLLWICVNGETSFAVELLNFHKCTEFIEAVSLFLPEKEIFLQDPEIAIATKIVVCLRNVELWIDRDVPDDTMNPREVCLEWRREGLVTEFYEETEHEDAGITLCAISSDILGRFSEVLSEMNFRIVRELNGLLRKSENNTDFRLVIFHFLYEVSEVKKVSPRLKPICAEMERWFGQHKNLDCQLEMLRRLLTRHFTVSSSDDSSSESGRRTPPVTPPRYSSP